MAVTREEYGDRQRRARDATAERGLGALVALSRGGGTHDRAAGGLWLAGVATPQPFVPDLPGHWRATGHVAVVVPAEGPVTAIVESDELREAAVADDVVAFEDVIAAAAAALGRSVAPGGRVGVLGADAVPFAWWTALGEAFALEPADDLATRLWRVKSPAEQELLRAAGRLGARAMGRALDAAVPGAGEADVAAAFFHAVVAEGGTVYDVAVSSGAASVTLGPSDAGAGLAAWTTRTLEAGDLLRIDAYGSLAGYLFDFARTIVVGGPGTEDQQQLIEAMRDSVRSGIGALRPGVPLADVARRCEDALAASAHAGRYGVPGHVMGGFWGHGLGLGFEPPWIGPDSPEVVEAGWCLAVERRAAVAGLGGAQYEDDVIVGPHGAELLTG